MRPTSRVFGIVCIYHELKRNHEMWCYEDFTCHYAVLYADSFLQKAELLTVIMTKPFVGLYVDCTSPSSGQEFSPRHPNQAKYADHQMHNARGPSFDNTAAKRVAGHVCHGKDWRLCGDLSDVFGRLQNILYCLATAANSIQVNVSFCSWLRWSVNGLTW